MRVILLLLAGFASLAAQSKLPPAAQIKVDFEKHIQPILAENCHSCHGPDVQQSGLRLDRRQAAMRGGDYGPVITPGNSATSKLIRRVVSGDGGMLMPPTGKLTDEQIGLLRAWIDQGADFRLEVKEEAPIPPLEPKAASLIAAVRSSDLAAIQRLLKADPALLKAQDRAGSSLLHHAAGFGSLATVQLLLEQGAPVNARNRRDSTPLHWAIHDEAKVRLLIERGAGINTKQADGRTPLYQAASLANGQAIIGLLLAKGADPNLATAAGQTPLMAAALRGDDGAMRLLIDGKAAVNAKNGAGSTALMSAATNGNPRAVALLLEKGADAKVLNKRQESALGFAATTGVAETVKLLLAAGAPVNARDDRGYSPLMFAAASDTIPLDAVKLLLAAGADASFVGEEETAKSLAAKRGSTEVAKLLGAPDVTPKGLTVGSLKPISVVVSKALGLLEAQSHNFIRIGGCNSCHAQDLPSAAVGLARSRGLPTPRSIAQLSVAMMGTSPERIMDLNAFGVTTLGWELFDVGHNGGPKDDYTDAAVRFIKAMQTPEGIWKANESRRPPLNVGVYQASALAIYSLRHFTRAWDQAASDQAIGRALAALEKLQPVSTQDRAFYLMALTWAGASTASLDRAVRGLTGMQRADGGWAQMAGMETDAFATGQALYALYRAGRLPAVNPVYEKGVKYLLGTQAPDGSWLVRSRSIEIQPYFESGFPYGHDQWISAAGTSWAAMALSLTVEPSRVSRVSGR
jgi:ankyrin repeat protein/mono/diheme cytochrome c family protein